MTLPSVWPASMYAKGSWICSSVNIILGKGLTALRLSPKNCENSQLKSFMNNFTFDGLLIRCIGGVISLQLSLRGRTPLSIIVTLRFQDKVLLSPKMIINGEAVDWKSTDKYLGVKFDVNSLQPACSKQNF